MSSYPKAAHHMRFNEVLAALSAFPPNLPLLYRYNENPAGLHNYRGYTEDLEISLSEHPVTVGEFLEVLEVHDGIDMPGYKGGSYPVKDNFMWIGRHSRTDEVAVTGFTLNDEGTAVQVEVRELEDIDF